MDRSRRQGAPREVAARARAADRAPDRGDAAPVQSRLTVRAKPNRRRAPTTPVWQRLPKPSAIMNGCGRMLRRSLPALIGLAVIGTIGGTAWAGYRFVTTSPRFALTSIEVRGNHRVTADQARAALPVALGDNVFAANLDSVTRELRTNPWVASAEAHRILPHTLVIDVVEHEPAAVADLGGLYLVDAKGHPFKHAEISSDEAAGLPIVTGLDHATFVADPAAAARTIASALDALATWRLAKDRPTIGEIHVDPHGALTLHTYDQAIAIQLGAIDPVMPARMKMFDIAWSQLAADERSRARAFHLDPRLDHVTVAFSPQKDQ